MRITRFLPALGLLVTGFGHAPAVAQSAPACRAETVEGNRYTICSFDPTKADLRVFWADQAGKPYASFNALDRDLAARGLALTFAMNGGMYQEDLKAVGLLVEDGREIRPINTKSVTSKPEPNFYKKPNGVFFLDAKGAGILATDAYIKAKPKARFATQSGPMLVIDGALHPAFIEGSDDRKPRNGVGVCSPTEVHFALSEGWVNFHDFATLFRDHLGCRNALFLDGGSASGLFAPELRRKDIPPWEGYGPIIGVVTKQG